MNIFKTLVFTILVPCLVTILIPRWLLSAQPSQPASAFRYFGLISIAIGAAIYLWCAWDFATFGKGTPAPIDPPKELVMRGLYRFTRNPMYVGVLSTLLGEAVLFESTVLVAYAGAILLLFQLFIVIYEEPALAKQFGEVYRTYCVTTPRWIPRFSNLAERPVR